MKTATKESDPLPKDDIEVSLAAVNATLREKNHRVLQPILYDLITASLITKQLHWNVIGPHFRALHLQLDVIYADLQAAVDAVAERISATGHSPSGHLKNVVENTELVDVPEGFLQDDVVALQASNRIRELAGLIRSRMAAIEDPDPVTADLLHGIVRTLEMHHWMLQAQRR